MLRFNLGQGSRPHIQIGNQSTVGARADRPHIVIDPTEGIPEEQRSGIQHMIQNILLFGKGIRYISDIKFTYV